MYLAFGHFYYDADFKGLIGTPLDTVLALSLWGLVAIAISFDVSSIYKRRDRGGNEICAALVTLLLAPGVLTTNCAIAFTKEMKAKSDGVLISWNILNNAISEDAVKESEREALREKYKRIMGCELFRANGATDDFIAKQFGKAC